MSVDLPGTYGALLIGAFVSMLLSGVLVAQVVGYVKMYREDSLKLKGMVFFIWSLDILHSAFVGASLWDYLVEHYSDFPHADHVPWTVPVTVLLTAILTFLAHAFFAYRIYRLSAHNLCITIPIILLVICRMCSACATAAELFSLQSFSLFLRSYRWLPTLGLFLSSSVDLLITASLFFYLGRRRFVSSSLDAVIEALLMYAFENCALTSFATILATICWITMPHNLLFLGAYFVVAKLYANSLLVTLNTRKHIRRMSMQHRTANMLSSMPPDPAKRKSSLSFLAVGRPGSRERNHSYANSQLGQVETMQFRHDSLASADLPAPSLRPPNRAYTVSTEDMNESLENSLANVSCNLQKKKVFSTDHDVEKQ